MRGSEVNINLSEMKEWTSALKSSDTMKIIALENGDIAMGAELRKSMSEKMADAWKIKLYATDDMKILAVAGTLGKPESEREKIEIQVQGYEQIKELISVDTLKSMQLLGFNYKAAIGEPLTQLCANAITGWGNKNNYHKKR